MSPIETPSEAAGHGARQLRGAAAGALVNLSGGDGQSACGALAATAGSLGTLAALLLAPHAAIRRCGATVVCNLVRACACSGCRR
jgi:hypothetical protein